jgi:hypothetical protein
LNKAVGFELLIGVNFWWDYDGFIVAVTEVGVLTRPLLSVTVKLNVREIVVETVGAINVGFTVFAPFRVTKGSDVWTQEYETMVAPLVVAWLPEPTNVMVFPLTVEDGDATATATGADWIGLGNGTQTPFWSTVPIGQLLDIGTQTPFWSTVPIGQLLDIGTQTPFWSTVPIGQLLDIGTQTPFWSTVPIGQVLVDEGVHTPIDTRKALSHVPILFPVKRFAHCGPVARSPEGHNLWNNPHGDWANTAEDGVSTNIKVKNAPITKKVKSLSFVLSFSLRIKHMRNVSIILLIYIYDIKMNRLGFVHQC